MMSVSLAMAWLQLLALLAAEVGLIALGVALLRQCSAAASWRRVFCQAGILAVLVVTVCELSGSARALGGWAGLGSYLTRRAKDLGRQAMPNLSSGATPRIHDENAT
jgi:hypothetical protein